MFAIHDQSLNKILKKQAHPDNLGYCPVKPVLSHSLALEWQSCSCLLLSVAMLGVIMLSDVILSLVMLSVATSYLRIT